MKRVVMLGIIMVFAAVWGCKKDTLSICENLLDKGVASASSIQGEWQLKSFSYTANGKVIKEKEANDGAFFNIDSSRIVLKVVKGNTYGSDYELKGDNQITIILRSTTLANSPPDVAELEDKLVEALKTASCYVVRDSELLIHYDKSGNRNIIVLQKK